MSTQEPTQSASNEELAVIRRASNIFSYVVIKNIMGSQVLDLLPLRVRCECPLPGCEEIIELTLAQRRKLRRSYPKGFILLPAHQNSSLDIAVFESAPYNVVEKPQFTQKVTDL